MVFFSLALFTTCFWEKSKGRYGSKDFFELIVGARSFTQGKYLLLGSKRVASPFTFCLAGVPRCSPRLRAFISLKKLLELEKRRLN